MINPKKAIEVILAKEHYKRARQIADELGFDTSLIYKWRKGTDPSIRYAVILGKRYPYIRRYLGLE